MSPLKTKAKTKVEPSLVVSEVFGPTFQGEGPTFGQRAAFIRLGACNLSCAWCDTPYTWDASRYDLHKELTRHPVSAIVARVADIAPHVVVLTGGEPLLWQGKPGWQELLTQLHRHAWPIEVETNGTIAPDEFTLGAIHHFNVSPKLANAGMPESTRLKYDVLSGYADFAAAGRATLKVVIERPSDLDELERLVNRVEWPATATYVMPVGTTPEEIVERGRELAPGVLQKGWNMTTRLQVLLWGAERGR